MRKTLVRKLTELMKKDSSIYLLTADTGFRVFDEFRKQFPDRYLNVGISEAAMIGMASGLGISGKQVFVYGIAPFVTMRCFEQIRIDLCYPNIPVKIIGVGGGLTYGPTGPTHHSIEDIAVMSCLPNMTVICPGDPIETKKTIEASISIQGPCYIRLGKTGEKNIHTNRLNSFTIGKGIRLYKGIKIAIIATGNMLETAFNAHKLLVNKGMKPELISMHTVKPIDRELIIELGSRCQIIATIEEHSIIGGLGSIVAGIITDEGLKINLRRFGIPDCYDHLAGSQDYLRKHHGLTAENIANKILAPILLNNG